MRSLFKFLLQLARCTSGSALLEMTIVVPLAISLMAGAVDFGLALSTQATLGKAVQDASRYLGSVSSDCNSLPGWAIANATNLVVYGSFSAAGNTLISNWTANGGTVSITCNPGPPVTVKAQFPYKSIVLASFLPIAATFTLSATTWEASIGQ